MALAILTLLSSPQTVTASWADVGSEISVDNVTDVGFWTKITINNSQNVQFRILAKHTAAHADEYEILGATYSAGTYTVDATIYELNSDADQKVFFHLALGKEVPVIQVQVKAGTVGATGATVDQILYDIV